MRVFLDSNVFLYAAGGKHPLRAPCRRLLEKVGNGSLEATTSTEVVQEIIHVLVRRGLGVEALRMARSVLDLFPDMLGVRADDMREATGLISRYPDLSTREAVHAATMLGAGVTTIVTADRHFDMVEVITRLDPSRT